MSGNGTYLECAVLGNLGGEPVERTTQGGKAYKTFSLAITDRQTETTEWVSVSCFEEIGDALPSDAAKGERCYAEGYARLNRYMGRDGEPRCSLQVTARKVVLLDRIGRRRRRARPTANDAQPADSAA